MRLAEINDGISAAREALRGNNVYAVPDSNVARLYSQLFDGVKTTVIPAGESNKNLGTVGKIISDMVEAGCDRSSTVVAVGGGVTGDTAGFAAACFMRGVNWINVPTTLLAMVDSGIGGKTGVDVGGYKNVAGAFLMPERVIVCRDFLQTLPEREWLCGCGEMIKHALLDKDIWRETTAHIDELISRGEAAYPLIEMSVRYKESVVAADFRESGLRKRLNVGHTVGHAAERLDGFRLSHGEYVALGIVAETGMFSERLDGVFLRSVRELCGKVCRHPFPIKDASAITDTARADKKNSGGNIVVMLPTGEGNVDEISLTPDEFEKRLKKCLSDL